MKKIWIFAFLSIYCVSLIYSNVREPYYYDKYYSGNITATNTEDSIIFLSETLNIEFPELDPEEFVAESTADMEVTYVLQNNSDSAKSLYVQFVGINVNNAVITLNDNELKTEIDKDDAEELDFIIKLAEHRKNFLDWEFDAYFNRIDFFFSDQFQYVPDKVQSISNLIEQTTPGSITISDVFYQAFGNVNSDFDLIGFQLILEPGENTLFISYDQGLFFNERNPGYGSLQLDKALLGVDYLFYPAFDWTLSDDFELEVKVTIPDYKIRKNIFNAWTRPQIHSNLEFEESYSKNDHINVYKNTFHSFPAEIFSFMIETED